MTRKLVINCICPRCFRPIKIALTEEQFAKAQRALESRRKLDLIKEQKRKLKQLRKKRGYAA